MTFTGFNGRPDTIDLLAGIAPDLHAVVKDVPIIDGDYETASIAWDGSRIIVDELFGARLSDESKVYVLAFFAVLIGLDPIRRRGVRDWRTWSTACNVVAHRILRERGIKDRPWKCDPLDMPRFDGMDEVAIHDALVAENFAAVEPAQMLTEDDLPE